MADVKFKEPRFVIPEATRDKTLIDVVMFVAGTTDPINTEGLKHQANTKYWQGSPANFWADIKELKLQYLNLHIEGNLFSWSGQNNTEERNAAADRLLDLLGRVYTGFKRKEVHLHLIGHSHGGNVINQFTNLIETDKRFPALWKVKSITYLSTPFFRKKHQLNHAKLHKSCQLINVRNQYDLTQQLIADFSLVNLEVFLKGFHLDNFEKGLNIFKTVDTSAFKHLLNVWINDDTEGPFLWRETAKALQAINVLTNEFIKYIKAINVVKVNLDKERDQFVGLLNKFLHWSYETHGTFVRNSSNRPGGYGRKEFLQDIKLASAIGVFNELFAIKTGVKDSYILNLLARIFAVNTGLTDSIELNSWTPKDQAKGLSIIPIDITDKDPYHSRGKKALCDGFIKGAVGALQQNNLEELLMRLISQFIKPVHMTILYYILDAAEVFVTGDLDDEVTKLRKSISVYSTLVKQFHVELVTKADEKAFELKVRPGGVPYLATVAHSLSHTKFWPGVESGLRGAFSSGKNPGYKKK
jgi:hypothetical protein